MKARCVICGARARSGLTCSAVCTRARKAGVSREEQFLADMEAHGWTWRDTALRQHGRNRDHFTNPNTKIKLLVAALAIVARSNSIQERSQLV